jgi:hypothetical protein
MIWLAAGYAFVVRQRRVSGLITPDLNSQLERCYPLVYSYAMRPSVIGVVLFVVAAIVDCGSRVHEPPRPVNVPKTATWAGGSDGGAFIECRVMTDGFDFCTVYNDSTGEVWMHGRYGLKGKNRGATESELVYSFADGDGIGLVDGGYLVPH